MILKKRIVTFWVVICCLFSKNYAKINNGEQVDLVLFSYNRPLQLYACLESIKTYVLGVKDIYVLYRADDSRFYSAYSVLKRDFNNVIFVKQDSINPKEKFKPQLLDIVFKRSKSDYVSFIADDVFATDFINLKTCCDALEEYKAYSFYLRLGKNILENYTMSIKNVNQPEFVNLPNNLLLWKFRKGVPGDWDYPNIVDMAIYRKSDIKKTFNDMSYHSPNKLEGAWSRKVDWNWTGLCFEKSKCVTIPLNSVQTDCNNLHMDGYDVNKLLILFENGFKIDISSLYKIDNKAPHMLYDPTFINRDKTSKLVKAKYAK